jgi:hypothetical protein
MTLTVELKHNEKGTPIEMAICCDEQGLELLIDKLARLRNKLDHTHLMSPSWAGNELTEQKQGGSEYELINHLRLVKV